MNARVRLVLACPIYCYGLCSYGLFTHGAIIFMAYEGARVADLCLSYVAIGLYSHGLFSYGPL